MHFLLYFPCSFFITPTAFHGAAEDAARAERERRGGWVADGGYAALVPGAAGEGWIGGERFNGGLGGGGFHGFSFLLVVQSATHSDRSAAISESGREKRVRAAVRAATNCGWSSRKSWAATKRS